MSDHGRTFPVAGHYLQRAEPPQEYQYNDGVDIIGYQCVDCEKWGQAVSEFAESPCARNADHRGGPKNPAYLGEALISLKKAIAMADNGHRDPALSRADEAASYIEDYRRGPLQMADSDGGRDE